MKKQTTCKPDRLPLRKVHWDQFIEKIGAAHATLGRYDELIQRVKYPQKIFSVLTSIESVASLHSQNVFATLEQVLRCLAINNTIDEDCDPGIIKILNYRKALSFAASQMNKKTFSFELLCKTHKIVKQDTPSQQIGKFRDQQNWIGPEGCKIEEAYFFPPNVNVMHRSMENLKEYYFLKDHDPLVQVAIFFAQFLVIHPFMDGNGRVGRIFIPFFLYQKKVLSQPMFYMSVYFKKHRLQYFQKLFEISSEHAWAEWISFFLKGIIQGGERQIKHARKVLHLYEAMSADLTGFKQAHKVLDMLFEQPMIQRKALKGYESILKRLEEKNWIEIDRKRSMVITKKLVTIDRK